ncbi:MAG TPA: hypothetical protein DCX80_13620, partial [Chloroflexi bacterium]|nr:hypothetical protein [Chloroflexota bacterium]
MRYPLIDKPRVNGPLSFEATFFPTYQLSSFFRVPPQSNGQPTPVPSYFRTTAGFPVDLLANVQAKGRFYLRPRLNLNREITDLPEIYHLTPGGGFEIAASGP